MTTPRTVAIVGLGLVGGSLARDLAAAGVRVLGHDRDPGAVRRAVDEGVVHAALDPALDGARAADAVVLAVPVSAAHEALARARHALDDVPLVTDVGSTKRAIGATAERLGLARRWVGAHPLAGDHRSGWGASREGLFRGARVFLCPHPRADDDALGRARSLWALAGARPEVMDADDHDRHLAWTSHLPQAAATALALALDRAGVAPAELGRGGRDMTRLAGGSPEMWAGIALENAAALVAALDALDGRLAALRAALAAGDEQAVRAIFTAGAAWSAPAARTGDRGGAA